MPRFLQLYPPTVSFLTEIDKLKAEVLKEVNGFKLGASILFGMRVLGTGTAGKFKAPR